MCLRHLFRYKWKPGLKAKSTFHSKHSSGWPHPPALQLVTPILPAQVKSEIMSHEKKAAINNAEVKLMAIPIVFCVAEDMEPASSVRPSIPVDFMWTDHISTNNGSKYCLHYNHLCYHHSCPRALVTRGKACSTL